MEEKKTAVSLRLMCRGFEVYVQRERSNNRTDAETKILKSKVLKDF